MISQINGKFIVAKFKATYNNNVAFITDKVSFESNLRQLLYNEYRSNLADSEPIKTIEEIVLPIIVYEPVVLTPEQQVLFEEIKDIPDITIDDVVAHINGKPGTSLAYQLLLERRNNANLRKEITTLQQAVALMYEQNLPTTPTV